MTRLELRDTFRNHYKFWEVSEPGVQTMGSSPRYAVTVRWGRIGTQGQEKTHMFSSLIEARAFRDSKVSAKLGKGYSKVVAKSSSGNILESELDALRQAEAGAGLGVPHVASPPSSAAEILASDNRVIREAFIEALPELDPADPCKLPWE